jgi:hypothetical protein
VSEHTHDWQISQEHSGRAISRYQCATCKRWGWRSWPRSGKVQPIVAYVSTETEPRPEWTDAASAELVGRGERHGHEDQEEGVREALALEVVERGLGVGGHRPLQRSG